jgi:long-subunit fatty acid transport protein
MRLRSLAAAVVAVLPASAAPAVAGGLILPGTGAISTSRAGAAIASADDGEALAQNPAGLAKASGTTITLSSAIISYSMEFTRRGTYDNIPDADFSYEGQPFATVKNQAKAPLGFGSYQPVPIVAVVTDLGGRVPNLHVAAGVYAPNAYPFRNMNNTNGQEYVFNGDFNRAPPPSRYDVIEQKGAILMPSIGVAYRIAPNLDVGARFSAAFAEIESTTAVWGQPGNVVEDVRKDALINIKAKDTFAPAWGVGVTYRPSANLELAATYNSQLTIHAQGDATNQRGPLVAINNEPFELGPAVNQVRCAPGGSFQAQKACVDFALPMTATLGGRYKLLGADGRLKGDIELNVGWENWSADLVKTYRVVVDADVYINGESQLGLKDNALRHNFKDVFTARLGGSYHIPQGDNTIIVRGGIGHDTAAAKTGWLRADIDGAARTTFAVGGAFRAKRFQVDVGGGFVYEGSPSNPGTCNIIDPSGAVAGCNMDGFERPLDERNGPDPIDPLVIPSQQAESPIAQGDYKAHYVMFMLGMSTWF